MYSVHTKLLRTIKIFPQKKYLAYSHVKNILASLPFAALQREKRKILGVFSQVGPFVSLPILNL